MTEYGKVYIYALRDPRTNEVFYVGRTKRTPEIRFKGHKREADKYRDDTQGIMSRLFGIHSKAKREKKHSNIRKLQRIVDIENSNKAVIVETLDAAFFEIEQDAARLEEAWIAIMRNRSEPLTNYIYSRRMSPLWYGPSNKMYKAGWAKTPEEYIERLKDGEIGGIKTSTNKPYRKRSRRSLKQLSNKAHRNAAKRKGKTPKRKRKTRH